MPARAQAGGQLRRHPSLLRLGFRLRGGGVVCSRRGFDSCIGPPPARGQGKRYISCIPSLADMTTSFRLSLPVNGTSQRYFL